MIAGLMSRLSIPLQGAINPIFGGHAESMLASMGDKTDDPDFTMRGTCYEIFLNETPRDTTNAALARQKATVPLTRALSKVVIDQIEKKAFENREIRSVVNHFRVPAHPGGRPNRGGSGRSMPGKGVGVPQRGLK
jgi:hypothetical protein